MLKVNLNLLKFHSFNYNKKYNNEWKKEISFVKEKFILENLKKHIDMIRSFETFSSLSHLKNFHKFSPSIKEKFFSIINHCHKNLVLDIFNIFSEDLKFTDADFNIYQFAISSRSRCIFLYNHEIETVFPIILDLKHCFYETKKNYDNNYLNENYEWDFKSEQENLKKLLLN